MVHLSDRHDSAQSHHYQHQVDLHASFNAEPVDFNNRDELTEWAECAWDAFQNPTNTGLALYFPPEDQITSITDKKIRESQGFLKLVRLYNKPHVAVLKAVDVITRKIMGGLIFSINIDRPYVSTALEDAHWHPEGPQREFVLSMLSGLSSQYKELVKRPHIDVNFMFVHPQFRNIGLANTFLNIIDRTASDLQLSVWAQVDDKAVPLFQRHGYHKHFRQEVHAKAPSTEVASHKAWRYMRWLALDVSQTIMWKGDLQGGGPLSDEDDVGFYYRLD